MAKKDEAAASGPGQVIGIRFERSVIERADKLVPKLKRGELEGVVKVSRNMVLRLAVLRGLEVLEKEAK